MAPEVLQRSFPLGIAFPSELRQLCVWNGVNGYPISGHFELRRDNGTTISSWFGHARISDRFGIFGAGPDGSIYAIWKQNGGRQPIVHLGSEGQNNSVLASTFPDFLRLLAIGYSEIGFDDLSVPPEDIKGVNVAFQKWVTSSFSVAIPKCGGEIVDPAKRDNDDFQFWIEQNL